MAHVDVPLVRAQFAQTSRRDNWWIQPLAVFAGLSTFIVYSTWAAMQGDHYRFGPYLSPFYSPELFGDPVQSWFGLRPAWIPAWVTAAMLILWAPGGFRLTCYYYRGAYYKAFWADPPSCTAEGPYAVQHALQDMMQDLVGIVRQEKEMLEALARIQEFKVRAAGVGVTGNREYNPGWHTAIDLNHLLTVSEMVSRAALERKESRGAHFRDDFPAKDDNFGSCNIVIRKGPGGEMQIRRAPIPEMPAELKQIIEEMR